MFLKTVTMQGFKSFANKTTIELNESITAIVGPNGSGKSNITDAITWVLGETSVKNLRGTKMEDVIFSGTDSKKPLGMAEVTIVFDNSDKTLDTPYNEVSVTRRMYRSLESEFLINNKKCRLKDIKELFMDTGIGKDGYSVIGQGKIESVLSSRPEDRRAIFEEAAGISKFKYKKVQSKNKLLKTEENLVRIEDLLQEISTQEENLKLQAQKATRYLEDYNRLKEIDLNFVSKKIKILNEEIEDLIKDIKDLKLEFDFLHKRKKEILEEKSNIETLSKEQSENLKSKKDELSLKGGKLEELKVKSSVLDEQIKSLNRDVKRINNDKVEESSKINSYSENLKELKAKKDNFDEEKEELSKKLVEIEKAIEIKSNEVNDIEKSEKEKSSNQNILNNEIENIKFRNETLSVMIEEKKNRKSSIDSNILNFENNKKEFKSLIESLESEKKEKLNSKRDLLNSLNSIQSELEKLKGFCQNQNEKLSSLTNELNEKATRLKILENMESNFEGYNRSVKTFMNYSNNKNIFQNSLYGPVGEKFSVSEEYEKAISVALGAMAQNIIVENTSETYKMLKILEKNKMGRITFLPLDRVKSRKTNKNISGKGVIGIASDLISFDNKFRDIFENLIGYVLIADNYEHGASLSKKYNIKVVTLAGEVFNTSGAITGGSLNHHNASFIQRKNEILELSKEVKNKNLEREKTENLLSDKQNEYNLLIDKFENLKEKLNELSQKLDSIDNNILKNKQSNEINEDYLSRYLKEKSEIVTSIEEDSKNLTTNNNLIEYKLKKLDELSDNMDKDTEFLDLKNELEKYKSSRLDLILLQKENKEKSSYNLMEIERVEKSIEESNNFIKELEEQLKEDEKTLQQKSQELSSSLVSSDAIEEEISILKNDISEIEELIFKNNEKLNLHKEEIVKINEKLLKNENERENRKYKIEVKRDSISSNISRIEEEYDVSKEDIKEIKDIPDVPEKLVKSLRRKVKNYGEVNVGSIEEYKLVSDRLDFYSKQRDDLIDAKEEIESILLKLDSEMKKSFKDAIGEISSHFERIFKILFNGGHAEINIEGDILESGIEIKASPPGKRLQSLSLLSGGERALTAVALLFALLKVRPASFCILDEIDAALDDANIKRYAEYLQTLKGTQFIIITHRKLTMEIAKSMYGVTMEEKGISTLYSVKLND